mmetsp:Transcript_103271/g.296444  ORF Transcript_103271/g.296444 Transcript_103271/m.296444 type:complete len:205 (-) Transcript_103271:680-1294(-)
MIPSTPHLLIITVLVVAQLHLHRTEVRHLLSLLSIRASILLGKLVKAPVRLHYGASFGPVVLIDLFGEGLKLLGAVAHLLEELHELSLLHARLCGPDEVRHHVGELFRVAGELRMRLQRLFVPDDGLLHVLASDTEHLLDSNGHQQLRCRLATLAGEGAPHILGELQELLQDLLHLCDHELVDLHDAVHGDACCSFRITLASWM